MEFNPIRNKIRQFTYESLVNELLAILKLQERDTRPSAFWHPLILLKWAMEFAECKRPYKTASRQDVLNLMEMVSKLELSHATFDLRQHGRAHKTFAILAFQQFTYQEKTFVDTFSRQFVLFKQLKHSHDLAAEFEKLSGLSLHQVLQAFYFLHLFIFSDDPTLYKYWGYIDKFIYQGLMDFFGPTFTSTFLDLLTVSRDTIGRAVEEDTRQVKDYNLQVFDVSFFTRKPLFLYKRTALIPHHAILHQTFGHFIYDYMKHRDEAFTTELGARMERYMKLGLDEIRMPYQDENKLRRMLGKGHKVVDFVLDERVLVEAKAIELKPHVSVNPEDWLLSRELRQTVGKAYAEQMQAVAASLPCAAERYGIIVTYKELFLGDSADMWEQFLEGEALRALGPDYKNRLHIPIENLFIMDLPTWDLLLQVLKDHEVSLVSLLQEVKRAHADPKTKKFYFGMHLHSYPLSQFTHQYLVDARKELKNLC
ncbi:hypothetical protein [Hymenobacter convexus]|uniref:hypothetical protein n=1 Tax=Hymenobacter sp. CA1UV-4 TaxID=3063782 RepID=UPI00271235A2|nr:hypothetical protein [Hymenobacter sp. CA1UV-4]MDO7850397.1 hypothetical protein [Hymenobacter sp. CA1UV-4]